MKRILFLVMCSLMISGSIAKTTYIPFTFSRIDITHGDRTYKDSCFLRDLIVDDEEKLFSIQLCHDSITKERVKAIKRAKRAAGWSIAAAVFSGVSAGLNQLRTPSEAVMYMHSINTMHYSANMAAYCKEKATSLEQLDIVCYILNTSNEEIVVNDMERGLNWYIAPNNFLSIDMCNGDITNFRIAPAKYDETRIKYVMVSAANYLKKFDIIYENDQNILYKVMDQRVNPGGFGYTSYEADWVDFSRETYERTSLSNAEEAQRLAKERKAADKAAKSQQ